jgi:integrase
MAERISTMTVREVKRRGKRILVIDIPYRNADGTWTRYRRDSEASTKSAAREEEKRIKDRIAKTGSPFEETPAEEITEAPTVKTFADVVNEYRASYMITDLKVSTRRGYNSILDSVLLPRLGALPITEVDSSAAAALNLKLTEDGGERRAKLSRATKQNIQIVLRSVLRFAAEEKKYISAAPTGMPRLKKLDQTILEIPSDEEVKAILRIATEAQRRAFGLMAFAGLRPNEVRALRGRDLALHRKDGQIFGGFLSIREGRSFGETDTPKTGPREVPLAPALARLLAPAADGPREGYLSRTHKGEPWGQYGLDQAFDRARNKAGLSGWSVYSLRHYAITSWLRRGIPVHVVQKMAGHKHLATTQRYVHFLKADLEAAAERLAEFGNNLVTPSSPPHGGPQPLA